MSITDKTTGSDLANKIYEEIMKDLLDRRGFRQTWDECNNDIRQEIEETIIGIIDKEINTAGFLIRRR